MHPDEPRHILELEFLSPALINGAKDFADCFHARCIAWWRVTIAGKRFSGSIAGRHIQHFNQSRQFHSPGEFHQGLQTRPHLLRNPGR